MSETGLLGIRKDLTYTEYDVTPNYTNEYICAIVKNRSRTFTILSANIQTKTSFDSRRLETIVLSTPSPHILRGDFNAYHESWGNARKNKRGWEINDIAESINFVLMNDGTPNFYRKTVSSVLDLTFVSSFDSDGKPRTVSVTDWDKFSELSKNLLTAAMSIEELVPLISHFMAQASRNIFLPFNCIDIAIEYARLRAIQRRAEQRARRTKRRVDVRNA